MFLQYRNLSFLISYLTISIIFITKPTFAISDDEVDKFIKDLEQNSDLDETKLEKLRGALSFLVTVCPAIKLQDTVQQVLNVDDCEDIVGPFYNEDNQELKPTKVLCESKPEIEKSVISAVYCNFHPIIKILQTCLSSVTTQENVDLMNSITMNMTVQTTREILETGFKILCKRSDTIERLNELYGELGWMDAISLYSCKSEFDEAKAGNGKFPAFIVKYAECLQKQKDSIVDQGKGLCGFFKNLNWKEYKKCLGEDYLVCDSVKATEIVSFVLNNDEIYEMLDRFLCKLNENDSLLNMFDNLLYKTTGYNLFSKTKKLTESHIEL